MPLINVEKLKLRLMRTLLPKAYLVSAKGYDQLPENQCAVCHDNSSSSDSGPIGQVRDYTVHNPYKADCGHVYCYYCIQSKLAIFGDEWSCLRCGERVSTATKVINKVELEEDNTIEEKSSSSNHDAKKE